mgnify:CR=1 FL=1
MCLILFSWDNHPKYKLILAANRDEFYKRPTDSLSRWEENQGVLAGRDLTGGGTWMGIHDHNRFTALTNHRDPSRLLTDAPSRGDLTTDFLLSEQAPSEYFASREAALDQYNGFNLLVGDFHQMGYFNNVNNEFQLLPSGTYGLSNAVLDTPWPKLQKAKAAFEQVVAQSDNPDLAALYGVMQDRALAADDELPQTGVPYEWEKAISAIFIETATYGTCCSTVLTITHEGEGVIRELSYPVGNRTASEKVIEFDWSAFK